MYPPLWGKYYWQCMHIMAYTFADQPSSPAKERMLATLVGILSMLPCPACSIHAFIYMQQHPPNAENRTELMRWVCDFHNIVNTRLNKTTFTYEESEKQIRQWCETAAAAAVVALPPAASVAPPHVAPTLSPTNIPQHVQTKYLRTHRYVVQTVTISLVLAMIVSFAILIKSSSSSSSSSSSLASSVKRPAVTADTPRHKDRLV